MKRREALTTVGVGVLAALSGCLGHSTDDRDHFEIERPVEASDDECIERELLDFERVYFQPLYLRPFGGENAVEWSVEMQQNEELYLRITSSDMDYPPELEVTDPVPWIRQRL